MSEWSHRLGLSRKTVRMRISKYGFSPEEAVTTPIQHQRHGKSDHVLYKTWVQMKQRCTNPNVDHYAYYGGRGIRVCDRWLNSFEDFLEDMGPKPSPSHSIDRIDPDGNYEPDNCRWAAKYEQVNNRRK